MIMYTSLFLESSINDKIETQIFSEVQVPLARNCTLKENRKKYFFNIKINFLSHNGRQSIKNSLVWRLASSTSDLEDDLCYDELIWL